MKNDAFATRFPSPLGDLFAVADRDAMLLRLDFVGSSQRASDEPDLEQQMARHGREIIWKAAPFDGLKRQIDEYFSGRREHFDLPIAPAGTSFQHQVWKALLTIPFGALRSYGQLAAELGRPAAARAVGRANATNPISLIVPCHRVIGANGSLTGYAGGEWRKQRLLELEGALEPAS